MSFLNKNKEKATKIIDIIWMNENAKWNGCLRAFQQS